MLKAAHIKIVIFMQEARTRSRTRIATKFEIRIISETITWIIKYHYKPFRITFYTHIFIYINVIDVTYARLRAY